MKKFFSVVLVAALASMMLLAGCSNASDSHVSDIAQEPVDESTSTPSTPSAPSSTDTDSSDTDTPNNSTSNNSSSSTAGSSSSKASNNEAIDPKLQEYLDAQKSQIDKAIEAVPDMLDLSIECEGSTLVYVYKYTIDLDVDSAKTSLAAQEDTLRSVSESTIIPEMEAFGIENPQVKYVYLAKDGSEIYSVVFK
jgi:hypothetical protein